MVDSREARDGAAIRRRRFCPKCQARFTTYEEVDRGAVWVVKRDGEREVFSGKKLLAGLKQACSKLPVAEAQLEGIVREVEARIAGRPDGGDVTSVEIGQLAAERLRQVDEVGYLRYVSMFRRFRDAGQFIAEIENLIRR